MYELTPTALLRTEAAPVFFAPHLWPRSVWVWCWLDAGHQYNDWLLDGPVKSCDDTPSTTGATTDDNPNADGDY